MSASLGARLSRRAVLRGTAAAAVVVALSWCSVAPRPANRIPRLGYMANLSATEQTKLLLGAFRDGLREHGYVEGETIQIEWRYAENRPERYDEFAAEFVRLPVDVIAANQLEAQRAAKRATSTIPIVMTISADPVEANLVESLARPGGNVTGMAFNTAGTTAKRLELLREIVPSISRVGVLWDGEADRQAALRSTEEAARTLQLETVTLEVRQKSDLPRALDLATSSGVDALLLLPARIHVIELRNEIVAYAAGRRIPVAYPEVGSFAEAGGLVAFGESGVESFRRAAYFVDRILKGAKPAELPIEQPTKFELVINLKTASALGVTIPQSVLSRATKVIQ